MYESCLLVKGNQIVLKVVGLRRAFSISNIFHHRHDIHEDILHL